jgi:membrane-associated phospholipid phosphatase
VLFALALFVGAGNADAQTRDLRSDAPVDLSITLVGVTLYGAGLALEPEIGSRGCRWCDPPSLDLRAREVLVWRDTRTPEALSDVTGFVLVPGAVLGLDAAAAAHDHGLRSFGVDSLVVAEATALALDAVEVAKLAVARERPRAHARRLGASLPAARDGDANTSFYSGHTSAAFALAAASGTVATLRGYRWAPLVWAAGGPLALGTGYLRIAADRHWLTDVLVGMVTGIAVGVAAPLLLHSPSAP